MVPALSHGGTSRVYESHQCLENMQITRRRLKAILLWLSVISCISYGVLMWRLYGQNYEFVKFNNYRRWHYFSLVPSQSERDHHDNENLTLPEPIKSQLELALEKANDKKVLLMWYIPWGTKDYKPGVLDRKKCGNCEITTDRSQIDNPATAALIFHWSDILWFSMPYKSKRRADQLYVWYCMESPTMLRHGNWKSLWLEESYKFNITMTYRRDSEIWTPYWDDQIMEKATNHSDILKQKSKFAIAMVSDCSLTPGAEMRMELLRMLSKDPQVEVYGRCFKPKRYNGPVNDYKFFLSFENSYHCRDYITEKLYHKAFMNGLIPVVWGASKQDYEELTPPGSVIFVEDFNSASELLDYMHYLDKNDTAYMEYFRWRLKEKKNNVLGTDRSIGMCALCRMVHGINVDDMYHTRFTRTKAVGPYFSDGILPRMLPSLKKWWYESERHTCLHGAT